MNSHSTIGYFRCNECGKKFIKKAYKVRGDIILSPIDKGELLIPACPKCKSSNIKPIFSIP